MSPVITKLYCRRWVSRCQGNLAWRPSSGSWRGSGQIGILWPCIGCKGVWEVQEKCQRKDVEVLSYRWEVPTEVVWSLYFQGSSWGQKEKGFMDSSFPNCLHNGLGTRMWQEVWHWQHIGFRTPWTGNWKMTSLPWWSEGNAGEVLHVLELLDNL